jgi:hypothetical protein
MSRIPLILALGAFALLGCKDAKKPHVTPKSPADPAKAVKKTPVKKVAPKEQAPTPKKRVKMVLKRTALTIEVPENATVGAAIIGGADSVTIPGFGTMVVKPRLMTDKTLDKLVPWAKGHGIQKYKKDVLKTGSDKTYTYLYAVTMGGRPYVIYHQMFQQRGKDYKCFANAKSEAAAKLFKSCCDTIGLATEPKAKTKKKGK